MSGALPPLFERLSAEADERPAFDDRALAESVRGELLRLLNTRRPANARSGILAYGLADWTAVQRLRAEDRRQLAREVRVAVEHFEPRLQLAEVEVEPDPGNPQRLRIQLGGSLRSGSRLTPALFVIEQRSGSRLTPALFVIEQGNDSLEVRHERFD
ncbi:type VI secretion system baseplate subunit TssE [Pseudomonas aeruginosa]|uniref:type VI secretion system baseplate subunit TssE n=3 Tax=Pseudomonas aeruginosa TaxID=287 RepID=UPI0024978977|nr:type VI secretion system baseplate subunit TssE [Pseudomonas aeruginosa]MDI2174627.1 type VI secretion system baseplate subunit TssE [Pseudomonas aeruginosa]